MTPLDRRRFLAGSGAVGLALAGGCLGPLTDDGMSFEAVEASVPQGTLDETGYEEDGIEPIEIERNFSVGDQSQTVEVTNWQAEYQKAVDLGPLGEHRAALFAVLSTPQVSVLGRAFNPVADMSTTDLVDHVQNQYEDLNNLSEESDAQVTILGEETTQTRFTGEVTLPSGTAVDIYLHVSEAVESGDDLIITVGGYPQDLPDEEENILSMMTAVEHDTG